MVVTVIVTATAIAVVNPHLVPEPVARRLADLAPPERS